MRSAVPTKAMRFFLLGLLPGPYCERFAGLPETIEEEQRKQTSYVNNVFPCSPRARGLCPPILSSLLQRHHTPVSNPFNCLNGINGDVTSAFRMLC